MNKPFESKIWREDIMPNYAAGYEQCEVCTANSRIIWGEGNPKASVVIILDNPGARENKEGEGFVCGTRETLQKGLNQAGLPLEDMYITYLLKCRPRQKYDKKRARAFSKPFLEKQIEDIKPKFIACLGDVVVSCLFNNAEASVKDMRGVWHNLKGIPAIVSYHPLAVRRRPNLTKNFATDWDMLKTAYFAKRRESK